MSEVQATFYDGRTSQARPVTLRFADNGTLLIDGEGVALAFTRIQVRIESRLGNAPRFVRLPDDVRCEVRDNDALDRALQGWGGPRTGRLLHRFEASWRLALLAAAVLGIAAIVVIRYGLPLAAKHIAYGLPMAVNQRIGTDTLRVLDRIMFAPSALAPQRQAELQAKFRAFIAQQHDRFPYELVFRASPKIGANAFALPNGTIVLTDELVGLAEDDDEILGVLAHERGHVQGRHALRTVLQNSAVMVVITLAAGDMSAVSAVGAALPTMLLESKYSRLFESEADAWAVGSMRQAGIDPVHLADILERLSRKSGADGEILAYVSSHPPTKERIDAITGGVPRPAAPTEKSDPGELKPRPIRPDGALSPAAATSQDPTDRPRQ